MTLVTIDLGDVAGGHHPDDHVIIRAENFREAVGGGITSTAEVKIPLVDGVGQAEVEPGPVVVAFRCQAVADTREKRGVVPASGPVGIEDVLSSSFIHSPPVINKGLEAIEQALSAALAAISTAPFGGYKDASVSLDTLLGAGKNTNSRMYYSVASGPDRPSGSAGIIDVTNSGPQWIQVFYASGSPGIWKREITDRTHIVPDQWIYTPWKRIDLDERYGQILPSDTDVNLITSEGSHLLTWGDSSILNLPANSPGVLRTMDVRNTTGNIQVQEFIQTNPPRKYIRDRNSSGFWQSWKKLAIDDPSRMLEASARRAAVVDAGLSRRGRVIGTGGKPAIALRFDHHLQQFGDKVLPLLKQHRLPWGQMLNVGRFGTGNDTWTPEQIAQEAHDSGGEVWNHSYSHSDLVYFYHSDREVTRGLEDLKTKLPSLWIDSFAGPGQASLMGMEGSEKPERFWSTYPGQQILAQHAFVRGYYPGLYQPLAGPNLIGAPHTTIDTQTAAWCESVIRGNISSGTGLTMMLHPNYLDTPGYMTTADLAQVLAYIAARRDAGELVVLSNAGILMANADCPPRNLITSQRTAGQVTNWSETISGRTAQVSYGVPHEAEVWAMGSGSVTLRVQVSSPTYPVNQSHTVTLVAGVPQRLSVLVTPPMDTTAITVSLTGTVSHTGIRYRPI